MRRLDATEAKAVSLNPCFGTKDYSLESSVALVYIKVKLAAPSPRYIERFVE